MCHVPVPCLSIYVTLQCFLLAYHVGCFKKVLLNKCGYWHQMAKDIHVFQYFLCDQIVCHWFHWKRPKRPNSRFRPNGKLLWPSSSEKGQNGEIWPEKGQTGDPGMITTFRTIGVISNNQFSTSEWWRRQPNVTPYKRCFVI